MNNEENKFENIEQNNEIIEDTKGKIKSVIFVTWFIASIISIISLSKYNELYSIIVFGQMFFVFGLIPLTQEKGIKKLIGLPFVLIGLAMIAIPILITKSGLF